MTAYFILDARSKLSHGAQSKDHWLEVTLYLALLGATIFALTYTI